MAMTHIKNLFVRGQQIPNSNSAQWIQIGRLYKDGEKQFVAMDSLALSPSLLMQLESVEKTTAVSLFDPEVQSTGSKTAPSKKPKGAFDDFQDDIPF